MSALKTIARKLGRRDADALRAEIIRLREERRAFARANGRPRDQGHAVLDSTRKEARQAFEGFLAAHAGDPRVPLEGSASHLRAWSLYRLAADEAYWDAWHAAVDAAPAELFSPYSSEEIERKLADFDREIRSREVELQRREVQARREEAEAELAELEKSVTGAA